MRQFLKIMQNDNLAFSLGRVLSVVAFVVWVGVTLFLVALNRTWAHYDTLTIANIGFLLIVLANKTVESKLFNVKIGEDKTQ